MHIEITPGQHSLIQSKIQAGYYSSEQDLLNKALLLQDEYDRRLQMLKSDLRIAENQIDSGEYSTWNAAEFDLVLKNWESAK